jgi:hypothetical protein
MIGHHTGRKSVKYRRLPKHRNGNVWPDLSGMSVGILPKDSPAVIDA